MGIKLSIKKRSASASPAQEKILDDVIVSIGSDPSATIQLEDPQIAPEQAVIINEGNEFLLINRADGTRFNSEPLQREGRRVLSNGDQLIIGDFLLILSLNGESASVENVSSTSTETALVLAAGASSGYELQRQSQENKLQKAQRSFADILDSLRAEEDKYYFQIELEGRPQKRISIEGIEMVLGWDLTGKHLSLNPNQVVTPLATVRKDWSGVIIKPQGERMIWINGEEPTSATQLKNGDRLTILSTNGFLSALSIVFFEPTSMLVLDSLLPQTIPPPVTSAVSGSEQSAKETKVESSTGPEQSQQLKKSPANNRVIFGYFSLLEIAVMIIGTLVTAAIIFLVLELSS